MIDVKALHAKIGELTLENDFLSGALGKAGVLPGARKMIDPATKLSVSRQAIVLEISRASVYYKPPPGVGHRSEDDAQDRQAAHGIARRG